jgi:dTDP-4-dehydrorhamnose 3,5-epimerase
MPSHETLADEFGLLPGAKKDGQSITGDWQSLQQLIDGVRTREIRSVLKDNGALTEIWRRDWELDDEPVDQVFQVIVQPGGISAWHTHQFTIDRLFVGIGQVKVVLYDGREDSPSFRRLNVFRIGAARPTLLIVPPGVWHGVQNLDSSPSLILNLVDRAYHYESPDHWRLPMDTDQIPYRFTPAL